MTPFYATSRAIHRQGEEAFLLRLLQSVFAAELLFPSGNLWLTSPWISDLYALDNRAGGLDALMPDRGRAQFRLSEVLRMLLDAGTILYVHTRDLPENRQFIDFVEAERKRLPSQVHFRKSASLHSKGLLGDGFYLRGSFNFTHSGVNVNEEGAEFTTDPQAVAAARIEQITLWEDA